MKHFLVLTLTMLSLSSFAAEIPLVIKGFRADKALKTNEFVDGVNLHYEVSSKAHIACPRGSILPISDGALANSKNIAVKVATDGSATINNELTTKVMSCRYDLVGSLSHISIRNQKKTRAHAIQLSVLKNNIGAKIVVECDDRYDCEVKEVDHSNSEGQPTRLEVHLLEY
jgi:hypothetical protein